VVRADVSLDYETCRRYEYTVSVSDRGDVPHTSTAALIVHVVDTDDERPRFDRRAYHFSVSVRHLYDLPVYHFISFRSSNAVTHENYDK